MAWYSDDLRPIRYDFDALGGDARLQFATLYTHLLGGLFKHHTLRMTHTVPYQKSEDTLRIIQHYEMAPQLDSLNESQDNDEPTHLVLDTVLSFKHPLEPAHVISHMLKHGFVAWTTAEADAEVIRLMEH